MAGEGRKLRGYDYSGNPVYEAVSSATPSREEAEEMLLRNLDLVHMFENGKGYFVFSSDEYFEMDENEEPDITHTVRLDEAGNIIASKPFDIMAG